MDIYEKVEMIEKLGEKMVNLRTTLDVIESLAKLPRRLIHMTDVWLYNTVLSIKSTH